MDKIYETTEKILQDCIVLRNECSDNEKTHQKEINVLNNKLTTFTETNDKMIKEIAEKNKMLSNKDKTIYDYEKQINSL